MNHEQFVFMCRKLSKVCQSLADRGVPANGVTPTGAVDHSWPSTRNAMGRVLGIHLSPEEITVLSLSRGYGPTPVIDDKDLPRFGRVLWPNGNPRHTSWYNWPVLSSALMNASYARESVLTS